MWVAIPQAWRATFLHIIKHGLGGGSAALGGSCGERCLAAILGAADGARGSGAVRCRKPAAVRLPENTGRGAATSSPASPRRCGGKFSSSSLGAAHVRCVPRKNALVLEKGVCLIMPRRLVD
ncbi:hypothetical protein DQ04_07361010 [Trypanosoma grayi]|uniref:hypothetical protein n=1 Tax=Trypanosoma grayi TaxID=71804 RepID=UPI0004F46143|nr:hypothetical protein DQ04_07361010 [Trypanosoma grayi]KEG08364.1 hypothetical protein DQ04_07361010 [Trypanosoma grayi]